MGRKTGNPSNNIIAFRINDEEMRHLQKKVTESGVNISSFMRSVLKQSFDCQIMHDEYLDH
ncbi:hypothetical protein SAMN02745165_03681 [Malonomonas rubra DSM 5091]|uniref:Ribbon-helix-helix protein, copG family n=1 Tax=Malonomonas rubra DSM 5091 TaxID=1122189 RepID=A0A1M6NQK6_MALRU|nr:hypothetical protein [Malonomonas rubra]SHJ98003.1 hypothetical protein SAMN02745165_03681 [Malonomonas rubra DSM 5091]